MIGMDFDTGESTLEIYEKLGMKLEEYALTENVELVAYDEIENIGNFVNFYNHKHDNKIEMPESGKNKITFFVSPIANDGGTYMNIKQNGTVYPVDLSDTKAYSTQQKELYDITTSMIRGLMDTNKELEKFDGNVEEIVKNNKLIEINLETLYDMFMENIKAADTK